MTIEVRLKIPQPMRSQVNGLSASQNKTSNRARWENLHAWL